MLLIHFLQILKTFWNKFGIGNIHQRRPHALPSRTHVLPGGSFRSFVPHSLHSPTSSTAQQEYSFIRFRCSPAHSVIHLLSPRHTPTQVKRCSSVVPFCSAKTYLQGIPPSNHVLFRPQIMLIFVGKYMFDEFTGKDVLRG